MSATSDEVSRAVGQEASNELAGALKKIQHCVQQLNDDQLWWRPNESMNSIANLLLHLSGNLRQWVIAGVGGTLDTRERQKEFDERNAASKQELMSKIEQTVDEAKSVLAGLTAGDLLPPRRIQGFDVTGLQAIFESVAHFRGHSQEIVHLTRIQLGESYQYDFIPSAEQGG